MITSDYAFGFLRLVGASLLVMGAVVLASSRGRHLAWPFFLGAGAIAAAA